MKRSAAFAIAALMLLSNLATPVCALPEQQSGAIQALLDEACRISGVPGMSLAIRVDDAVFTFSSGYADREMGLPASENTLYELASVSKAFTAMGILLMEEQGLLSMDDTIQAYLPWFTLRYRGRPVDMQNVTLRHFLHHTSGLTNSRHSQYIPQGDSPDMLQKTVESLTEADLSFCPGERYQYGTVNYDVLGLVMEVVSGQSYEAYMKEQVLEPLGLHRTYVYQEEARATGQLAQGYRTSFLVTVPYDAPDYAGNKPAGYIISCAGDMARWMGIQMGAVQDIPDRFREVIKVSRQGDMTVADTGGMYYAAGWSVNADQTIMEHPGGNPNFSSEVAILLEERTGICLLTNGANTNVRLVAKVKEILDGNLSQSYERSGTQLLDIALSSATVLGCLVAVLLFLLGWRRKKKRERQPMTGRDTAATAVALSFTGICWAVPLLIGHRWTTILVWQTYSVLTACLALALLSASATWLVYTRRYHAEGSE